MSYISAIRDRDEVIVWERIDGKRVVTRYPAEYYFYVPDANGEHESIFGDKVRKLSFENGSDFRDARARYESDNIRVFETDIPTDVRVLAKHYYNVPPPKLHYTFYDIEVDYDPELGFSSVENPYAPLNSIAIYHEWSKRMIIGCIPSPKFKDITLTELLTEMDEDAPLPDNVKLEFNIFKTERELLFWILDEFEDSDVITGWNSGLFDTPYLAARIRRVLGKASWKRLCFPEGRDPVERDVELFGRINKTIDLSGRISIDYLVLFKNYEMGDRPTYKLESVADDLLPDLPKLHYEGSLRDLYYNDFPNFVRYNLRDTEILKGFEDKLGYLELANVMVHLSCGQFDYVTGTLKLAELAINNYCHYELNKVVNNKPNVNPDDPNDRSIEGAIVLEPKVGMHKWLGAIDINSLYPSCIMAINISPETQIGQFDQTERAVKAIHDETEEMLTLHLYDSDVYKTQPAWKWKELFLKNGMAISGYGTVYRQDEQGVIPMILDGWFTTRKKYQKMKKDEYSAAEAILAKYKK
jgi:DNA polymerase elongation subunit (family B)